MLITKFQFMAAIMCNQNHNIDHISPFEKELPEDLWVEIFIRSSVESLLRLKAVCKLWYAITKNPSFTNRHLKYQKMISRKRGLFLFQHVRYVRPNCFLFDEDSLASGATSASSSYTILLDPCMPISSDIHIHGPINGLYCVYNGMDRLVIWNPATSEVGFVPFPQECIPNASNDEPLIDGAIGFGTDPLNEEDYKVMLFCRYEYEDDRDYTWFETMLYTTSTNTWGLVDLGGLDIRPDPMYFSSNNTYLNGVYYWLYESLEISLVLAFDMGKIEAVRKIPINHLFLKDEKYRGDIALHEDHIALFMVDQNKYDLDIWVLTVEDHSWSKMISVKGIQGIMMSLGFWRMDDELLLVIDDGSLGQENCQVVVYNTTTHKATRISGPRGWYFHFRTTFYYESLKSVAGGMVKCIGNHAYVVNAVSRFLRQSLF